MRLISISALCIAAFVTVQAQEMFTSSPETATYCRESCIASSDWSPDECLELCLDYYDSHPLPLSHRILALRLLSQPQHLWPSPVAPSRIS